MTGGSNETGLHVAHLASFCLGSRLYRNLFTALLERGVRQTIHSPRGPLEAPGPLGACRWVDERIWGPLDRVRFRTKIGKYERLIERARGDERWDLIHAHTLYSDGFAMYRVARALDVPMVVTVRTTDVDYFGRLPHLRADARRLLDAASAVVFVNPQFRRALESRLSIRLPDEKVHVVPNGVDDFWLRGPAPARVDPRPGEPIRVISVGRIIRSKNYGKLADAIRRENARGAVGPLLLTVVGDLGTGYARRLRRRHESEAVRFVGARSKEELRELFAGHDVFAMVSGPENFGLVYVEALSQGLPVVYANGQGFDGWTDDRRLGVGRDAGEPGRWVEAIASFERPPSPGTVEARAAFARRFNWPDLAAEWHAIYRGCTAAG